MNHDYIDAVQQGDVGRFEEILADDFRASNPDGSIVFCSSFFGYDPQRGLPVCSGYCPLRNVVRDG